MSSIFEVEQPLHVRLRKGTELHAKTLARVKARHDLARKKISTRYDEWDRVDEFQRMHLDLSRKARRGDKTEDADSNAKKEMPFKRGIVIPVTFAINEVMVAQMLSLFAHREPPLPVEGHGPEDVRPAKLLEATLAYDTRMMGYIHVVNSMLNDTNKYGLGVVYDVWDTDNGWATPPQTPITKFLRMLGIEPQKKWQVVREFNRWTNVDPYKFWPDPRVSLSNLQEAEFVGHRVDRSYTYLLQRSIERGGRYFNLEELGKKGATGGQSRITTASQGAGGKFSSSGDLATLESADEKDRGFFAIDAFQIRLIPREWQLADSDEPEIWWLTMADETTIIRAHESGYEHSEFTYAAPEIDPDPHTTFNPGTMERLDGLQRMINWMYNSHIENVMRTMNDRLVVARSLVELVDLINNEPGGIIRLTAEGEKAVLEGRLSSPGQAVSQLLVQDITSGNLRTGGELFEMAQRASGANDPAMGQPLDSKRTLGEVQSILAASNQRLSIKARLIEAGGIAKLARRAISNRQQFTELEQYFKIAGDLAKETGGVERLMINRGQLQGNFDYTAHTTMMPADPARDAAIWSTIYQTAASNPALLQPGPDGKALDVREIFNEMVRRMGVRNIQDFYIDVRVVPDQQFEQGVQAGNYVPVENAGQLVA